ncbi:hypothetical protein LWI29_002351 [Acer saccharum]|uniref:Protein FAR1-RELATED SEQUENCE n=1 Tax=Acer saccharum TaxID=4024 RepID=A0AA39VAC1_ACESA|nr:hypothetical protein LWI29_002351 [Acer saccharum]
MTDGDEAMRQAIDEVFPNCQHRVCGWHVARNACAHINGPKKSSAFRSFIFDHIDEDKFDECWNEMIKQHGLEDNVWVNMIREKLFDLFPQIDKALMRLRNNFFTDEYASNTKSLVILSHMKSLEKHATSIYTYCIYYDITKEINNSIKYSHFAPWNEENEVKYILTEYDSPYKKTVSVFYHRDIIEFQQVVEDGDWDSSKHNLPILSCECKLLQNKGIPYCHMFYVMKVENITKIPESLIFKRWTKSAADDVQCNYICHRESQIEEGFNLIKMELNILRNTVQGLDDEFQNNCNKNGDDSGIKSQILKDPNVVKTKGRPTSPTAPTTPAAKPQKCKRPNQCRICHISGHDWRNYPKKESNS